MAAPEAGKVPPAPRRRVSPPREPAYWRWAGVGLALLAAVALVAAWVKQRQHEDTVLAPATSAAEGALEKPGQQPRAAPAVPERPPRERVDRPGEGNADDPLWRRSDQEFRGADTGGDGFLSQDEARRFPLIAEDFKRVDTDGDGRISLQEFMRLRRWQAQQRLEK